MMWMLHSGLKFWKKLQFRYSTVVCLKDQNQHFLKFFLMEWPLKESCHHSLDTLFIVSFFHFSPLCVTSLSDLQVYIIKSYECKILPSIVVAKNILTLNIPSKLQFISNYNSKTIKMLDYLQFQWKKEN